VDASLDLGFSQNPEEEAFFLRGFSQKLVGRARAKAIKNALLIFSAKAVFSSSQLTPI
jgi:hypothetical protein